MSEPGMDRSPWNLWLANSGIAAVWGACFGLIAILASRIVPRVEVRDAFWDGDVGQGVVIFATLLVLTGMGNALFTSWYFRSAESFHLRIGINLSIFIFCVLSYVGVILIFSEVLGVRLNDRVLIFAMVVGVLPSPFIVRDLSERFISSRHAAD